MFGKVAQSYHKLFDKKMIKAYEKVREMQKDFSKRGGDDAGFLKLETEMNRTSSPDLILEGITMNKKYNIDKIISRMYKTGSANIKQVEDFEDETTAKLKQALASGKDAKSIIREQREILNSRTATFLEFSTAMQKTLRDNGFLRAVTRSHTKEASEGSVGLQEFHTPPEIADELMGYSKILTDRANADKNIRILEPTAGYGALVNAVVKARNAHGMNQGYTIEMIEMNPDSRLVLQAAQDELKGVMSLQEQTNFLTYISNEQYDMIVMNPPFHLKKKFSKLPMDIWDGDFIAKAYTLLKPGGEILAIATSKAFDLSHNSLTRAKKTKTKVGAMDLSHFNMPPPECVNVEREYKAHR